MRCSELWQAPRSQCAVRSSETAPELWENWQHNLFHVKISIPSFATKTWCRTNRFQYVTCTNMSWHRICHWGHGKDEVMSSFRFHLKKLHRPGNFRGSKKQKWRKEWRKSKTCRQTKSQEIRHPRVDEWRQEQKDLVVCSFRHNGCIDTATH